MATNHYKDAESLGRDSLALTRTQLANERTMLAYSRTAIMLAVTGVTLLNLYSEKLSAAASGWAFIAAAVGVGVFGMKRYIKLARVLQ